MNNYLFIILVLLIFNCSSNNSVIGEYKAVNEDSVIKRISFDGNVATFKGGILSLAPSMKYEVKDEKIYVDYAEGTLVFDIINLNTIECKTSIFEGEVFKK